MQNILIYPADGKKTNKNTLESNNEDSVKHSVTSTGTSHASKNAQQNIHLQHNILCIMRYLDLHLIEHSIVPRNYVLVPIF